MTNTNYKTRVILNQRRHKHTCIGSTGITGTIINIRSCIKQYTKAKTYNPFMSYSFIRTNPISYLKSFLFISKITEISHSSIKIIKGDINSGFSNFFITNYI